MPPNESVVGQVTTIILSHTLTIVGVITKKPAREVDLVDTVAEKIQGDVVLMLRKILPNHTPSKLIMDQVVNTYHLIMALKVWPLVVIEAVLVQEG